MVLLIAFANCGGTGVGNVVLPICMYFFGFSGAKAIALSNSTILVTSLVRYIQNFNEPHPSKNGKGTLVDYSVCMLMFPMIVAGIATGTIIQEMFSALVKTIILVSLLTVTLVTTLMKLSKIQKYEKEQYGPITLCGSNSDIDS